MQEELAPAKINLALAVLGVREDGYHEVDTVMHSVELSDSVYFMAADDTVFRVIVWIFLAVRAILPMMRCS